MITFKIIIFKIITSKLFLLFEIIAFDNPFRPLQVAIVDYEKRGNLWG